MIGFEVSNYYIPESKENKLLKRSSIRETYELKYKKDCRFEIILICGPHFLSYVKHPKCITGLHYVQNKCNIGAKQVQNKFKTSATHVRNRCKIGAKQVQNTCKLSANQGQNWCKIGGANQVSILTNTFEMVFHNMDRATSYYSFEQKLAKSNS